MNFLGFLFLALLGMTVCFVDSCTMVEVPFGDQKYNKHNKLIGRTMELGGKYLRSTWKLGTFARGERIIFHLSLEETRTDEIDKRLSLYSKYAFIGIQVTALEAPLEFVADGMNEHGLSVGVLTHRGAFYQDENKDANSKDKPDLIYIQLVPYLLGNCRSIAEVIATLESIRIIAGPLLGHPGNYVHWTIHDADGESIVVEYIKGTLNIHQNTVGVLTNDPSFDWHLRNLNNYAGITPFNPDRSRDITLVETEVGQVPKPVGHGFNLFGIPGDFSPASRFVKTFFLKQIAIFNSPPRNEREAQTLVTGLINSVFLPYGTVAKTSPLDPLEFTQFALIKNLKDRVYMFRTYDSMVWKKVDMKQLMPKLQRGEKTHPLPLFDGTVGIEDVTDKFL